MKINWLIFLIMISFLLSLYKKRGPFTGVKGIAEINLG